MGTANLERIEKQIVFLLVTTSFLLGVTIGLISLKIKYDREQKYQSCIVSEERN